jgi:hypothetical protein
MLHGVLNGVACEQTPEALEDHFRDHYLGATYHSEIKSRARDVRDLLQEFATGVEQCAYHACSELLDEHIKRKAGKAFADGVEDPTIKIQLLLGREKTVNKALRLALKLRATLLAFRPPKQPPEHSESRSLQTVQRDQR